MNRGSTLFLKIAIILIAVAALVAMIQFPKTEGRAANLDLMSIYSDPLIIYAYFASIPFFIALFQAFKLLNLIDANQAFSQSAVNKLKNIKIAAISLIGFIAIGVIYIHLFAHGDDPAAPTMVGLIMAFASGVIATAAGLFQKLLQNAVDLKSENDLTV